MATDDAVISNCMKTKYLNSIPCNVSETDRRNFIHTHVTAWYWDCGGYSEGGIGPHEIEMNAWSDAKCAQSQAGQPPAAGCTEGTTRQVKCPKNNQMVTQKCVNGSWATQDSKACAGTDQNIALLVMVALILIIVFFAIKGSK